MRLLALHFFSLLHAFLGNSSLYTLSDDKLVEWNMAKQHQLHVSALGLVFASLLDKVAQLLHSKGCAMARDGLIERKKEGNAVSL